MTAGFTSVSGSPGGLWGFTFGVFMRPFNEPDSLNPKRAGARW